MADIDKKTYLFLVHLFLMLFHRPFQFFLITFQCSAESFDDYGGNENGATENEPPRAIPWREYG